MTDGGPGAPLDGVAPVVELRGITRTFERDPPVYALRDVDLSIWPGEWLAIVGPSGSGKSTLLNVLGLLDRPTEGRYLLEGVDVDELDDLGRAGLRGRRIGFIFQAFHLLPHRSVLENVMLAELYMGAPRRGRQERALAALDRVGLSDRADFLPTRLSGGQRQRAAIARSLMGEPSLLLCDEPTGNLDTKSAANVLDILGELSREGLTLIVITHDDHVAARADRRVRIIDGQLGEVETNGAAKARA
ncbi:MAG TPA: ABC transporter ATP-binding protein [Acidimicrobiia bacterium]|nr:ABC transporter ATP-binding protein [Acidimicrobiia bacterium]